MKKYKEKANETNIQREEFQSKLDAALHFTKDFYAFI